jgi:hypothetical protein
VILIGLTTILLVISLVYPWMLNDSNSFLKEFVGSDYLAVLGFIVSITIASAIQVHLHLNTLADQTGKSFRRTRGSIRRSCNSLVWSFVFAVILVTIKPLLPTFPVNAAVANSIALIIIYFCASVMLDIVRSALSVPSRTEVPGAPEGNGNLQSPPDGKGERN